jgi:alkaline phosphatase D
MTINRPKSLFQDVHGPIIGESDATSVVVWYRNASQAKNPPLLTWCEVSSSGDDKFAGCVAVQLDPEADFTSKTKIANLKPNTKYLLRVGDRIGGFKTPGAKKVTFLFGSCIGGQGFGRNLPDHPDGEGFPIFSSMADLNPDFFYCNGDFIYADNVIESESTMFYNKGKKNYTPPGTDCLPAASDLESFRDRYKYNLEEEQLASFLATTPVFNTWDDHEITNDFGGEQLCDQGFSHIYDAGKRVFFEYWPLDGPPEEPMRIYRSVSWGPHVDLFILDTRSYRSMHKKDWRQATPQMKHMLGKKQHYWLMDGLSKSSATWKFICTSVPLSYPTGWPEPNRTGYDGWSDGNYEETSGAELEMLTILKLIRGENIKGVIFLSGDVHFPYCLSYDPFKKGEPLFYEMAATPFHALCLPPPEKGCDMSFNPTVHYAEGEFASDNCNFGHIAIEEDGSLTFNIRDIKGKSMFEIKLPCP